MGKHGNVVFLRLYGECSPSMAGMAIGCPLSAGCGCPLPMTSKYGSVNALFAQTRNDGRGMYE